MKDLIKKLKDKNYVRAFGLMSEEEQDCYRKVGQKNCMTYSGHNWTTNCHAANVFNNSFTYAIKSDYESEFVDLEIEIQPKTRGKYCIDVLGCMCTDENIFFPIDELPSLPNFMYFWKDNDGYKMHNEIYQIGRISLLIQNKTKVYARIRRDK